jgi:hypothetical protein
MNARKKARKLPGGTSEVHAHGIVEDEPTQAQYSG